MKKSNVTGKPQSKGQPGTVFTIAALARFKVSAWQYRAEELQGELSTEVGGER